MTAVASEARADLLLESGGGPTGAPAREEKEANRNHAQAPNEHTDASVDKRQTRQHENCEQ